MIISTETHRVRRVEPKLYRSSIVLVGVNDSSVRLLCAPSDFDRVDFLPAIGQAFDVTMELHEEGEWGDGMGAIHLWDVIGIANVDPA